MTIFGENFAFGGAFLSVTIWPEIIHLIYFKIGKQCVFVRDISGLLSIFRINSYSGDFAQSIFTANGYVDIYIANITYMKWYKHSIWNVPHCIWKKGNKSNWVNICLHSCCKDKCGE